MTKKLFPVFCILLISVSCNLSQKSVKPDTKISKINAADTIVKYSDAVSYQASATRTNDIIHTKLDVRFDWSKAYLYGKATITAKPYFYPTDVIDLDARGMDINEVDLLIGDTAKKKLNYIYENNVLSVKLDKRYAKDEIYKLYIDYVSKPNELKVKGGSEAITDDKGLYFINPDGKDKNKPQQIWTQGETQSNSCWFPTIDRPNERMTDEIYITVDKKYVTLSNGELAFSTENADGTRTDYWKMDLPHAPYLVMMAIGEYAIVKDHWKDKEVNYYVEKEYEPHAKAIFGNTPEMIEFFSNKLGVPYQWNKYSQVVVRDYVSGAMENTSATIHGEFVQKTDRELLDNNNEYIVSHELFHQWFGDLVTCESWSNIPLNESFATYGEYLWKEYKNGRDDADRHEQTSLSGYLREATLTQKNLIRFYYDDREKMFDRHSYNKGGRVLHMLRKYVGDDAFFASLKLYLETNKFNSVEIHNLRLAFEQVTGEDLNWFFNQWFLSSGHPQLIIESNYNESSKKQTVTIKQLQDLTKTPVFKIPMDIDVYYSGKKERHRITITKTKEDFAFDIPVKPNLVNVDAEKMLLCTKEEKKPNEEWAFQYRNAPLYLDRYEALNQLSKQPEDSLSSEIILSALHDKYWYLRSYAITNGLKKILPGKEKSIKEKMISMAQNDEKSLVRANALQFLSENYKNDDLMPVYKNSLDDLSYSVISEALTAVAKKDPKEGIKLAKSLENEKNDNVLYCIANIYSENGTDENNDFFIRMAENMNGYEYIGFTNYYTTFLKKCNDESINKSLPILEKIAKDDQKYISECGQKSIKELTNEYTEREKKTNTKLEEAKKANANDSKTKDIENELEHLKDQKKKVQDLYNSVTQKEEKK